MAAMIAGEQFQHGAGLAMGAGIQNNGIVEPFHDGVFDTARCIHATQARFADYRAKEFFMRIALLAAGLLIAAPAFAATPGS